MQILKYERPRAKEYDPNNFLLSHRNANYN